MRKIITALLVGIGLLLGGCFDFGFITLEVKPDSLNFGNVAIGTTRTLTFKIINTSSVFGDPLKITQVTVNGAGFSTNLKPLNIDLGESPTFEASFDPKALGPVAGSIVISSNASFSSPDTISLSGTGFLARPAP